MTLKTELEEVSAVRQIANAANADNDALPNRNSQPRWAVVKSQHQVQESLPQTSSSTDRAGRSTCITDAQLRAATRVLERQLRRASPQPEPLTVESAP